MLLVSRALASTWYLWLGKFPWARQVPLALGWAPVTRARVSVVVPPWVVLALVLVVVAIVGLVGGR